MPWNRGSESKMSYPRICGHSGKKKLNGLGDYTSI